MLSSSDVESIAAVCSSISNAAADESGFVPIRHLLSRFRAELVIRPLLVEGMLASVPEQRLPTGDICRWAVLLDSETYDVSHRDVQNESSTAPLPMRLRNTVAHELVHSFALRPADFGLRLRNDGRDPKSAAALVKKIEEQTEHLSPLLLCSERALEQRLKGKETAVDVEELARMYKSLAVSKHVLVSRLKLIRPDANNRLRLTAALRNVGIGLAQWTPQGTAFLRRWPLFVNFDRNIVPSFLHTVARYDFFNPLNLLSGRSFAMCGGLERRAEITVDAGTADVPTAEKIKIELAIEETSGAPGTESLFVVRRPD